MKLQTALVLGHAKSNSQRCMEELSNNYRFITLDPKEHSNENIFKICDGLMSTHVFKRVVSTSESYMEIASLIRERYGLPGPSFSTAIVTTNKLRMRQFFRDIVLSPEFQSVGEFIHNPYKLGSKVVLKPMYGSAARGVEVLDVDEALQLFTENSDHSYIVEKAIKIVNEFHCDGIVRDNKIIWSDISQYDRPVIHSSGTRNTVLIPESDYRYSMIQKFANSIVAAIHENSFVFHLEIWDDGNQLWFGEIGLRPGGTGIADLHRHFSSVDLWKEHFKSELMDDNALPICPDKPKDRTGLIMARSTEDGIMPLPEKEVHQLADIKYTETGNILRGDIPENRCEYEYIAFFSEISDLKISQLMKIISRE